MRPLCCASILLLMGIPIASESSKSIHADKAPNAEEEIKSLEAKLTEQILSGNPAYGDTLAEDYVLIRDDGSVHTKSEMTSRFTARDPANRIEALQPSNLNIRIYGDTAVMNFELNWTQTVNGRRLAAHSRLTKVFIKRDGHWVHGQ